MPDKVCIECSTDNLERAKFCITCGFRFEMSDNICSKCRATNPSKAKFCLECGNQIDNLHTNKDNQSELEMDGKQAEEIRLAEKIRLAKSEAREAEMIRLAILEDTEKIEKEREKTRVAKSEARKAEIIRLAKSYNPQKQIRKETSTTQDVENFTDRWERIRSEGIRKISRIVWEVLIRLSRIVWDVLIRLLRRIHII